MTILGTEKKYAFDIEYSCELNNGIHNLQLIDIYVTGLKRFTYKNALTECFVPLNKKDRYEKLAIRFLKHCYEGQIPNYPLDVTELILLKNCGCFRM